MQKEYKEKGQNGKVIVLAILTAVLLCGLYYDTFLGKGYIKNYITAKMEEGAKNSERKKMDTASRASIPIQSDSKTQFHTNGKNFLQCSKDGIKYFSGYNNQKWNDTFTMANPIMIFDENMTAVGELMGRSVRVYNEGGLMYTKQKDQPIIQMSLNKNGYLGVITNNKTDYTVEVYNAQGAAILTRRDQDEGVYPIALDISDDNRVLAVSYVDTRDVEIISRVLFFYLNDKEGKEFEDSMFASIDKPDEMIPMIAFMKDNRLAAVSDRSIFTSDLTGKELWKIPLNNKLDQVELSGKNSIVIANGEVLGGKDGKEQGLVEWISLDGKILGSFQAEGEVTYLNGTKNTMVVGSSRDYNAVGDNGKSIWHYKATQDVDDILIMENNNIVLFVSKNSAEILDISKLSGEEKEEKKAEMEAEKAEIQEEMPQSQEENEDPNNQEQPDAEKKQPEL